MISDNLMDAVAFLADGEIIAYPTEAVYGLGCDPFNKKAVLQLLSLKERNYSKGFILIASNWQQIQELIQPLSSCQLQSINNTWPGPLTWAFPASETTPKWLLGEHSSIAIRVTKHPIAKALCDLFKSPLVSTSANPTGYLPAKTYQEVEKYFDQKIPFILKGEVGGMDKPTPIRDVVTGKLIRS